VQARLTNASSRMTTSHAPTFDAFDLYLQGVHALDSDLDRAEDLLRRSIAADPAYARPHVALARLYGIADILGTRPMSEIMPKSRRALASALELDPMSADAHSLLGTMVARHEYQWEMAERGSAAP